jgi:hypothetical protein
LINKSAAASVLTVRIDGHFSGRKASVIRLRGPAIDAKTGVTLGDAEVSPPGAWSPAKPETLSVGNRQLGIKLAAASAAIVQIA